MSTAVDQEWRCARCRCPGLAPQATKGRIVRARGGGMRLRDGEFGKSIRVAESKMIRLLIQMA